MNPRFLPPRLLALIVISSFELGIFVCPPLLKAQQRPTLVDDRESSSAVDTKGVRHRSSDYPRKQPPWVLGALKTVAPQYPYAERTRGHTGSGLFRILVDLKTGSVVKVITIKSTGFPALDNSAVDSFRRWRWKPGTWKEIDLPITFILSSGPHRRPPDAIPIPRR
jgi:TonB family protein